MLGSRMSTLALKSSKILTRPVLTMLLARRCFSTTCTVLYPRYRLKTIEYRPTGYPLFDEHLRFLFGNMNEPHIDGVSPNKLQGQMLASAAVVRDLLVRVKEELPRLKEAAGAPGFVAPTEQDYVQIETFDLVSPPQSRYDQRHDPDHHTRVRAHISVARIRKAEALTENQVHLLRLIGVEHRLPDYVTRSFDPVADALTFETTRYPHRAQNKRFLLDRIADIVTHLKTTSDFYTDVPLNLQYAENRIRERKRQQLFDMGPPAEWIEQNKQLLNGRESGQGKEVSIADC